MTKPSRLAVAVVTGASAGIGLETARALLAAGWSVLGVARRPGGLEHPAYRHERLDLGDLPAVEAFLLGLVADPWLLAAGRLGLVNAAARLGPMRPLTRLTGADLALAHGVNAVAPLLLSSALARLAGARPLRIVDVSSPAARFARAGRAVYSTSKAALRLGGMALAAERAAGIGGTARDLALVSYEPGMVDTAMQAENRAASPEDLPDTLEFRAIQAEGRLVPPARPAAEIAALLDRDDLPGFSERALGG
jgi:NAD(P)-dependent dehydrogenase (short-subunit alcohol dehydrogenase family)